MYFKGVYHHELGSIGELLEKAEIIPHCGSRVEVVSPPLPGPNGPVTLSVLDFDQDSGRRNLGFVLLHYYANRSPGKIPA